MKKIICLLLVVLTMCTLIAACSKNETFTCDVCGKTVTGHKNTATIEGETGVYCDDCKDEVEAMLNLYNALGSLDLDL